jgi:hypothetical protein
MEMRWEGVDWINLAQDGEHGDETSNAIKGGEFLDYLSNYQLLRMDSAPWS